MIAESNTERPITKKNGDHIRRLKRELRGLFMSLGSFTPNPKDRIGIARKKIAEAQNVVAALRERYPVERYPKGKFGARHRAFAELEASYREAEDDLRDFEERYLRRIKASQHN